MARSPKALVKPEILVWAREDAGYPVEAVAKRLRTKIERVQSWEAGDDQPTVKQLRRLAQMYRRPLAVFYLQEVPSRFQVMHDFRRLDPDNATYSPELLLEMRSAHQRRALALDLFDEIGEEPPRFELHAQLDEDPEDVGLRIRKALRVDYRAQRLWRPPYGGLTQWRSRLEQLGVLIFQATQVATTEMRGFSFAEDFLPVIVINRKDAPNGRTFSLLHELAHLMIHQSGLCEMEERGHSRPGDRSVEVFCNAVAAAALMPKGAFLAEDIVNQYPPNSEQWALEDIYVLASRYCVSREAVTRRLLTFGRTTTRFYRQMRRELDDELERRKVEERKKLQTSQFMRNPPQEAISNYGKAFVQLVLDTYHQNRITLNDVSSYLSVRTRHVPTIESKVAS